MKFTDQQLRIGVAERHELGRGRRVGRFGVQLLLELRP